MGRMWPVAIKHDVDIDCGFIVLPRHARDVVVKAARIANAVRVRVAPRIRRTRVQGIQRIPFLDLGEWREQEKIRVREAAASLTRNCGLSLNQAASGKNSWMILYPVLP